MLNKTRIVDLWDTDKPASTLNGGGPDNYEDGLLRNGINYTQSQSIHSSVSLL